MSNGVMHPRFLLAAGFEPLQLGLPGLESGPLVLTLTSASAKLPA